MHKDHPISSDLWDFKVECCKKHYIMNKGDPHTNQAFDLEALKGENKEQQETEALDVK